MQMHCAELPALASWQEQHPSYRTLWAGSEVTETSPGQGGGGHREGGVAGIPGGRSAVTSLQFLFGKRPPHAGRSHASRASRTAVSVSTEMVLLPC